ETSVRDVFRLASIFSPLEEGCRHVTAVAPAHFRKALRCHLSVTSTSGEIFCGLPVRCYALRDGPCSNRTTTALPGTRLEVMNQDRRGFRFSCNAAGEVAAESSPKATIAVRATELSLHGCYLETPAPFPAETPVVVKIFH